jgi:glyoxalase family protein
MTGTSLRLGGLHHVTMITADVRQNVRFYGELLGLRLVKKTVNFDEPSVYHLYFGDERGSPGSILTWFEFPDALRGRPGAGMIHRLELGVPSETSLDFWEHRLADAALPAKRTEATVEFADYDGLDLALVLSEEDEEPLRAHDPAIPKEHAITGIRGARAHAAGEPGAADDSGLLTQALGFEKLTDEYFLNGTRRSFRWAYDPPPDAPGIQGAGTVHHIAWACEDADQPAWRERVQQSGGQVTPVLDREYFTSIYFREPQGVLFEIATIGPGFAVDEDPAHLGEELRLPPQYQHLKASLENTLTPLENPRARPATS